MVARNVKVEGTFCAAGTFTAKICFYVYERPFILSSILLRTYILRAYTCNNLRHSGNPSLQYTPKLLVWNPMTRRPCWLTLHFFPRNCIKKFLVEGNAFVRVDQHCHLDVGCRPAMRPCCYYGHSDLSRPISQSRVTTQMQLTATFKNLIVYISF